jgi:DNA-binding response OmpR family regulator
MQDLEYWKAEALRLRALLSGQEIALRRALRLSKGEAKIIAALVRSRWGLTRDFLAYDVLYWDRGGKMPDSAVDVVSVTIHRMRRKLKPRGLRIVRDEGTGYALDQASRDAIAQLIGA